MRRKTTCGLATLLLLLAGTVAAQEANVERTPSSRAEFDMEIYLIIGSKTGGEMRLPSELNPVLRRLRAALPLSNYRLGMKLLGKITSGSNFQLSGVRYSADFLQGLAEDKFSYLIRGSLKDAAPAPILTTELAMRLPFRAPNMNVVSESVSMSSSFFVREGEPIIAGSLDLTAGESLIWVINLRRVAP